MSLWDISPFSSFIHSWLLILFLFRIHQRYRDLNTELIPEDFTSLDVQPKLKYKFLQQLPELKVRFTCLGPPVVFILSIFFSLYFHFHTNLNVIVLSASQLSFTAFGKRFLRVMTFPRRWVSCFSALSEFSERITFPVKQRWGDHLDLPA